LLRTGQAATWKVEGDRVLLTLPGGLQTDLDEVAEVTW
jgi:uncharacterized protein YfaQ (DUF2300 family)